MGQYAGSPLFCASTTEAMRAKVARTCSSLAMSVMQPVGDVLAGNSQGGAVFHQADVVDVRHLGAANALADPAHHVAQNPLGVVV